MINFDKFEKMSDGQMVLSENRYISFYEDDDSLVLDGSFTVEELLQLITHLTKRAVDVCTCGHPEKSHAYLSGACYDCGCAGYKRN
jgi:hypothetical protein